MSGQNFAFHPRSLTQDETSLHESALLAAEQFRKSESALIDALISIERKKVFRALGYSSLFTYATGALKLSEAVAYNAIAVARKAAEVPELKEGISAGVISISKARKVLPVLKPENQGVWLPKVVSMTSRELEKEVARENPRPSTPERALYISSKRLNLNLCLDEPVMIELRKAQNLVSRSKGGSATLEETLQTLARFYLEKKDPVERAKRVIAKKGLSTDLPKDAGVTKPVPGQVQKVPASQKQAAPATPTHSSSGPKRTPIPAAIEHAARLRDGDACQFVLPSGRKCLDRRWVDFHHIIEVANGGKHELDNLITLCRPHHQAVHAQK